MLVMLVSFRQHTSQEQFSEEGILANTEIEVLTWHCPLDILPDPYHNFAR